MMKRALRFAGGGCLLLCICFLCLINVGLPYARSGGAREAASGFLDDVRIGSWQSALQRMGTGYQSGRDAAHLQREVQAITALSTHTAASFPAQEVEGDEVRLEGFLSGPEGSVPVAIDLSHVNDYWYVDLVVVQGRPLR